MVKDALHPSHVTRVTIDASSYDEICVNCGETDIVPGGWGNLRLPCAKEGNPYKTLDDYYNREGNEYEG